MSVRAITGMLRYQRAIGIQEFGQGTPMMWDSLREVIEDDGPYLVMNYLEDSPFADILSDFPIAAVAMSPEEAQEILGYHRNYRGFCAERNLPYQAIGYQKGVMSGLATRQFADVVHLEGIVPQGGKVSLVTPELVTRFYPEGLEVRDVLRSVFHGEACLWVPPVKVERSNMADDIMHFVEDEENVRRIMGWVDPEIAKDALSRRGPSVRGMYVTY